MLGAATLITLVLASQASEVVVPISEISGTVERIDRVGRMVTIRSGDNGVETAIYAGPELAGFDQLDRGDFVSIRFYDSYIVEATPQATMKGIEDTTKTAQQAVTDANSILQQLRLVVTIDELHRGNQTVTYHGADNRRVLRGVTNPELFDRLKVGDVVTITYTRARAASIEKRR
jgi:hypothetical protein